MPAFSNLHVRVVVARTQAQLATVSIRFDFEFANSRKPAFDLQHFSAESVVGIIVRDAGTNSQLTREAGDGAAFPVGSQVPLVTCLGSAQLPNFWPLKTHVGGTFFDLQVEGRAAAAVVWFGLGQVGAVNVLPVFLSVRQPASLYLSWDTFA